MILISVFSKQIIIVVLTNIIILVYFCVEVADFNSTLVLTNVQSIQYYISKLGLGFRVTDYAYRNNITSYIPMTDITTTLLNLKTYQKSIFQDYAEWSYCSASEMVYNNKIPFWVNSSDPVIQFTTLYNFIDLVHENVKTM